MLVFCGESRVCLLKQRLESLDALVLPSGLLLNLHFVLSGNSQHFASVSGGENGVSWGLDSCFCCVQ